MERKNVAVMVISVVIIAIIVTIAIFLSGSHGIG